MAPPTSGRMVRAAAAIAIAIAIALASVSSSTPDAMEPPAENTAAENRVPLERVTTIRVRPPRVHCGTLAVLSTDAPLADVPVSGAPLVDGDATSIRWSVDRGTLWYDDLGEVEWRAPRTPGPCRVRVRVERGSEAIERTISVTVHRPSTRGMVWIPPGEFLRGDVRGTMNDREVKTVQNSGDEPFHTVRLGGYWIDRHPVTNRRYASFLEEAHAAGLLRTNEHAVMGEFEGEWVPYYYFQPYDRFLTDFYEVRPSQPTTFLHVISWDGSRFRIREGHEEHPVVDVTWFGAAAYADHHGTCLPTEAQWEKAARGPSDARIYPWGDELPSAYHASVDGELQPVGTNSPVADSPYGVADMVTPAFEWSDDWWNTDFYRDYLGPTPLEDPAGPFWGTSHAIRGFPQALEKRIPSIEKPQPVSRRYNWRFEFVLGDCFANRETTFRTVVDGRIVGASGHRGRGADAPAVRADGSADGSAVGDGEPQGDGDRDRDREGPEPAADGPSPPGGERPYHSTDFEGSRSCRECHPRQYLEWRGSTHAYALLDPIFVAEHRKAQKDTKGEVGTLCLGCHGSIGVRTGELGPDFDGLDRGEYTEQVREAVSCEACHRAEPPAEGDPIANASFRLSPGNVQFGRLHRPEKNSAHRSGHSDFLGESRFCGSCHDVVHRGRQIERAFAEWQASVNPERAIECQDCHMLRYSGQAAVGGPFRETLRRHNFPGVATSIVPFPNQGYQEEQIREFLRTAARLSVLVPEVLPAGRELSLPVTVKNSGTGHNLPSGSMRQMWLEVTVTDASDPDRVIFRSGHLDPNGDLRDRHSEIDPQGDPQLVNMSDTHVGPDGEPKPFWLASATLEESLRHLEERTSTYRFRIPSDLEGGSLRLRVRLLLRPFPPYGLRHLGIGHLSGRLPVWEVAGFDSGPVPARREPPRRTKYRIPGDFDDLITAVERLRDGDRLEVGPGEYPLSEPLDFRGRSLRIVSLHGPAHTVLRLTAEAAAGDAASVVVFRGGEGPDARLEGFTVEGGRGTLVGGIRLGGCILVTRSSPTIAGNRIREGSVEGGVGGGIAIEQGAPRLLDNEVEHCRADLGGGIAYRRGAATESAVFEGNSIQGNRARLGGGIYVEADGALRLERAVVAGNIATETGAALWAGDRTSVEIRGATFVHNRARRRPGLLRTGGDSPPRVLNSIFWSNRPFRPGPGLRYCLVDRLPAGADDTLREGFPLFRDPGGAWSDPDEDAAIAGSGRADSTPGARRWVPGDYRLLLGSPAIDAGDPRFSDPDDTLPDLGGLRFEQPRRGFVRGDVDGSGRVDRADLELLAAVAEGRGTVGCLDAADVDDNGVVDTADVVRLSGWIERGSGPPAAPFPDCGLDPTPDDGLSCQDEPPPCQREDPTKRPDWTPRLTEY